MIKKKKKNSQKELKDKRLIKKKNQNELKDERLIKNK